MGNKQVQIINEGVDLHKIGKYEEAIQKYDQVIEVNPNDSNVYSKKATSLYELGRYEEAIQVYNQALIQNPNDSQIYYFKGLCYYELKLYNDVIQFCEQAIFMNQTISCIAEVFNLRGLSFFQLGLLEEAISSFDDALNYDQTNKLFHLYKANTLRQQEKYEQAIQVYDTGIQYYPQDLALLNSKAICLMRMCRYEDALKIFDHTILQWPQDYHILSNKGVTLFYLARFEEALDTYNNALILQPNHCTISAHKAFCLIKLCRSEEAELILYRILPKLNEDPSLLGKVLVKLGKFKEAKEVFQNILQNNPKDHQTICQIALTQAYLGEYEHILKDDIKWEQFDDNVQIQIASVFEIIKDFDSAIKYFDLAISKNPKNSEYYYMKAKCFYQQGQFMKALINVEKAIEITGENLRYNYYNLKGQCELETQQLQNCTESFLRALQICPWKFTDTFNIFESLLIKKDSIENKQTLTEQISQILFQCQKHQSQNYQYQNQIKKIFKYIEENQ